MGALQVESRTAEKLRQLAAAHNVSVEELLATYIPGLSEGANTNDAKDKAEAFEEWAQSFPPTPPLSDEAISRASIYRDR